MNVIKEREKSSLLRGMEALRSRMTLSAKDERYFSSLKTGYEGEKLFDRIVGKLINKDAVLISDLLLNINSKNIQIDALLLTGACIYIFEIKNFSGEFIFDGKEFEHVNGYVTVSPIEQLNRSVTLFSQLLKQWNVSVPVVGKVVFVNKIFTLFAPEPPCHIILPTQLETFLTQLNNQINPMTNSVRVLANRILTMNQEEVPYQKQLPEYDYDLLKKGLGCTECKVFDLIITQRSCRCKVCEYQSSVQAAILQSIDEYKLLFPNRKLITVDLYDWMGGAVSSYVIKNTLKAHYKRYGKAQATYYE